MRGSATGKLGMGMIASLLAACTGTMEGAELGEEDGFGVVEAELATVPAGIGCVALRIGGSISREVRVGVSTGARTTMDTGPLPLVPLVFQATAYPTACAAAGDDFAADPSWISDAVELTPRATRTTPLSLVLRQWSRDDVQIDFAPALIDVAMTADATYWVTADGRILAAGAPATVGALVDVREIEGAAGFACARHGVTGNVSCWGANDQGQLGNGSFTGSNVAVTLGGISNVVDIDVGQSHACALEASGRVTCWGGNRARQASQAPNDRIIFPTTVTLPAGVVARSVHTGNSWSCITATDGGAYCWGQWHAYSSTHALSTPTLVYAGIYTPGAIVAVTGEATPRLVSEVGSFVEFDIMTRYFNATRGAPDMISASATDSTTCVVDWRDDLYCVGTWPGGTAAVAGSYVQPRRVDGAVMVEVAANRVCAIDRLGEAWCWGENGRGEVGDGTTQIRTSPARARQLDVPPSPSTWVFATR